MSDLIKVIVGSTREGRVGISVGNWVVEAAKEAGLNVELVDLKEVNLPFFNEPNPPMQGNYTQQSTKDWAAVIEPAAGFIFVTPEYNGFFPATLKNAVDTLYNEWTEKPAGIVAYGAGGGVRALESLKTLLGNIKMDVADNNVTIKAPWDTIADGVFTPTDEVAQAAATLFGELKN